MPRKYPIILADPPWSFDWNHGNGAAEHHYDTLSVTDLLLLPVEDLAADTALLFMWACWSLLPAALDVMRAWGFQYKTLAWVWVKQYAGTSAPYMGNGQYARQVSEPCLLGVRGAAHRLVQDHGVRAILHETVEALTPVLYAPRAAHSRKPDEQYLKIRKLVGPDLPRVELFARQRWPKYDVWGHGVTGSQFLADWIAHGPAVEVPYTDQELYQQEGMAL